MGCEAARLKQRRRRRLREHGARGGGRFRAEIEIARGVAIVRSPEFGFAAAVREPLVKLQRPTFDFEMLDWVHFAWPHDRPDANLEMRDSDPRATFEADRKAADTFLDRCTVQLHRYEMDRSKREQQQEEKLESKDYLLPPCSPNDELTACSAPWRHGCAESNPMPVFDTNVHTSNTIRLHLEPWLVCSPL